MITDFNVFLKNYVYEPIDLCACYEPLVFLPASQRDEPQNPFSCTVLRKIGNTWYTVETECAGSEPLPGLIRRLIFSGQETI